ncbi:MAG: universal stress protein [Anaerolineae bacterium]
MFTTMLVPLDGSPLSERALPIAAGLAQATGAQLILMRAAWAHTTLGVDPRRGEVAALDEAEHSLRAIATRLSEQGVHVHTAVCGAPPVEGILREVDNHQADLVIMCTHGRSGLGRWIYGSVAEEVLARITVPVLLVRPVGPVASLTSRPRLLVPLDGSPFAEVALPHAAALAQAFHGSLCLIRVESEGPSVMLISAWSGAYMTEEAVDVMQQSMKAQEAEAKRYLGAVRESLRKQDPNLADVQTVVRVGWPNAAVADVIVEEGEARAVSLIVMSTHGRTGIRRALLGSVATGVLHGTRAPVLLVPPHAPQQRNNGY